MAIHGSMSRDLDLVAIPWTEDAASAEVLVGALLDACGFTTPGPSRVKPATLKPHGRKAWSILLDGGCYLDLSVMPRDGTAGHTPKKKPAPGRGRKA
jgi:hypothetical protein